MNIQYKPTLDDFVNLQLFATRQMPRMMKQAYTQLYIGWFLFCLCTIISAYRYLTYNHFLYLIFCGLFMMLAVSYSRFNLWLHKLMLRQKFKQIEKNKDNAGIYLSVDEEELIVTENKGQYIMKTSDLEMFVEVEDYFFVQMQKEMFLSIPKHQLTNEKYVRTEFQRFASLYNIPYKEKFDWVNDIYNKKSKL